MRKLLLMATALFALQAQAATVCKDCEYTYYGRYLGAYWPGDRGTFGNRDIERELGFGVGFDNYWVLDLNNNARVTLTVQGRTLASPPPFSVEVYLDAGSQCAPEYCLIAAPDFTSPLVSRPATRNTWQATLELVPGRYLIRVSAETRTSGKSAYTGTLDVR